MNSLFGGMNNGASLLMQAAGAMRRGESPQAFMQRLAQTYPQLRGLDFSNLQATAQQICMQKGVDPNALAGQIQQSLGGMK